MLQITDHLRSFIFANRTDKGHTNTPALFFARMDENKDSQVEMSEFVRGIISTDLPEECGLEDIQALFRHWDRDSDGTLSLQEIELAFAAAAGAGLQRITAHLHRFVRANHMTPAQFFQFMDVNGDATVDLQEFVAGVAETDGMKTISLPDVHALYKHWDTDGSGNLSLQEMEGAFAAASGEGLLELQQHLRAYLQQKGLKPADFFTMMDANGDCEVEMDEFVAGVASTHTPGMPPPSIHAIHALFHAWDLDQDGTLNLDEMREAFARSEPVKPVQTGMPRSCAPGPAGGGVADFLMCGADRSGTAPVAGKPLQSVARGDDLFATAPPGGEAPTPQEEGISPIENRAGSPPGAAPGLATTGRGVSSRRVSTNPTSGLPNNMRDLFSSSGGEESCGRGEGVIPAGSGRPGLGLSTDPAFAEKKVKLELWADEVRLRGVATHDLYDHVETFRANHAGPMAPPVAEVHAEVGMKPMATYTLSPPKRAEIEMPAEDIKADTCDFETGTTHMGNYMDWINDEAGHAKRLRLEKETQMEIMARSAPTNKKKKEKAPRSFYERIFAFPGKMERHLRNQFRNTPKMDAFVAQRPDEDNVVEYSRWILGCLMSNPFVTMIITVGVMANSVCSGLHTDFVITAEAAQKVSWFFMGFFVTEILLKLIAFGSELYFSDSWNTFDAVIVGIALTDMILAAAMEGSSLPFDAGIIRMLRIFRIARLVSALKQLEIILSSFLSAIREATWVAVLTALLVYIAAVMATILFGKKGNPGIYISTNGVSDQYFGTVARSMFSLMGIKTLEWSDEARLISEHAPIGWLFFTFAMIFLGLGILNLFTAIFVEKLRHITNASGLKKAAQRQVQKKALLRELQDVVSAVHHHTQGHLNMENLIRALAHVEREDTDGESITERLKQFEIDFLTIAMCSERYSIHSGDVKAFQLMLKDIFTMGDVATKNDLFQMQVSLIPQLESHATHIATVERRTDSLIQFLKSAVNMRENKAKQSGGWFGP